MALLAVAIMVAAAAALFFKNVDLSKVVDEAWAQGDPADLKNPKTYHAGGVHFNYPANWSVSAKADTPESQGHWLEISTNNASSMQLILMKEAEDEKTVVENGFDGIEGTRVFELSGESRDFFQWGKFRGFGRESKGKLMLLADATVRIFCVKKGRGALLLIEIKIDREDALAREGFALIEKTFDLP